MVVHIPLPDGIVPPRGVSATLAALCEDLGIEEPETYAEYEAMLIRFRDDKGAAEPFVLNGTGVDSILIAGMDTQAGFYVVDGTVTAGYTSDEML